MREYRVVWEIEIPARTWKDAARQAMAIQRDPKSIATVFDVYLPGGRRSIRVDLGEAGLRGSPAALTKKKVYVVVKAYRGVEEETRAFGTAKAADRLYRKYAKECGVPYDHKRRDYDWSQSDYSVWWSACEVEE